jgi:hypothetical protein
VNLNAKFRGRVTGRNRYRMRVGRRLKLWDFLFRKIDSTKIESPILGAMFPVE